MIRHALLLAVTAACGAPLAAQSTPIPIRDNSFLIEEAFNQEAGVIQHISTFSRPISGGGWAYSFTEEWPMRGMRHQASVTVPILNAGSTGVGDVALNYRYQLRGVDGGKYYVSPRASLLLATGDEGKGFGSGGFGIQTNLPMSAEINPHITLHGNVGLTHTFTARNALGDEAAATSYAAGGSLIWLVSPVMNLMLETVYTSAAQVVGPDDTQRVEDFVVSPGIRYALNFGDLQVVPGLAYTIGVGPSSGSKAVFVYLSFEHPWSKK